MVSRLLFIPIRLRWIVNRSVLVYLFIFSIWLLASSALGQSCCQLAPSGGALFALESWSFSQPPPVPI